MNSELNTQGPTEKQMKSVEKAIEYFKNGKMVIIVDDEGRENEGDIALPAQDCKPEDINFMATIARGLICTPLDGSIIFANPGVGIVTSVVLIGEISIVSFILGKVKISRLYFPTRYFSVSLVF